MKIVTYSTALVCVAGILCCGCGRREEPPPAPVAAATPPREKPAAPKITNRAASITGIALSPAEPRLGDEIVAKATGNDADGDSISFYYQWYINDKRLMGQVADRLPGGLAVKGDLVAVEVVGFDGTEQGPGKRSASLRIANTPPVLKTKPSGGIDLNGFRLEVTDADNDPITYRLEGAPPNLSIDQTGKLSWVPQDSDKDASYEVSVIGQDPDGASVSVRFPINVRAAVPPKPITVVQPAAPKPPPSGGATGMSP